MSLFSSTNLSLERVLTALASIVQELQEFRPRSFSEVCVCTCNPSKNRLNPSQSKTQPNSTNTHTHTHTHTITGLEASEQLLSGRLVQPIQSEKDKEEEKKAESILDRFRQVNLESDDISEFLAWVRSTIN